MGYAKKFHLKHQFFEKEEVGGQRPPYVSEPLVG
jgi:hypothetical protein